MLYVLRVQIWCHSHVIGHFEQLKNSTEYFFFEWLAYGNRVGRSHSKRLTEMNWMYYHQTLITIPISYHIPREWEKKQQIANCIWCCVKKCTFRMELSFSQKCTERLWLMTHLMDKQYNIMHSFMLWKRLHMILWCHWHRARFHSTTISKHKIIDSIIPEQLCKWTSNQLKTTFDQSDICQTFCSDTADFVIS